MRSIILGLAVLFAQAFWFCPSTTFAVTLGALQDADVATGDTWDDVTVGTSPWIVENYSLATSVIGHIQFDVSSFSPGTVQSAVLRLFQDFNSTNGVSYDIYRVDSPWDEATVTYNTRPALDSTIYSTLAIADSANQVWREWDVTSLVQEWVDGTSTNYGLAILRDPDEQPWPYFRSKDYNLGEEGFPELVVTIPEPASLSLVGLACGMLWMRRSTKSG